MTGVCCSVWQYVLQCVAVCVAVCCSVLQCVALCCSVSFVISNEHNDLYPLHTHERVCVRDCVAVCCSVLQCVAVCCSELQCLKLETDRMTGAYYTNKIE